MTTCLAPSKRDQLLAWMKAKGVFRTHEVIQFGLDNYFNRALREKGAAHHAGLIRELTKEEKALRGFTSREGIYEYVGEHHSEANYA